MRLQSWALGLPRHLRFDEINLSLAMTKLSSPLPATSMSGWMYAYMHAIAESAMFYLQAGSTNSGCGSTAQRQSQAVENIGVILEALGPRGRESPLGVSSLRPSKEIPADRGVVAVVLPLTVLANWQDQLRTSTPTTLDDRLTLWWTEITHSVGISRSNTTHTSRHLTSPTALTRTSPTARVPPPSSLGLYATSPPQPGLESAVSTSSSTTLPTPTYRILPPLPRPRASSSSVVYPSPRRHRHLPSISMSALGSEVGEKVELPPLEIFRYRPMSTFFDRTPEKGEDRDRCFQDGKDRPVSPFLNRDGGQPVKGEKEKEKEKEKGERNGHSLVGIAALVSAAEEKSREREVDVAE